MGITKSNLFTAEQNALAKTAKMLGHPARIAIIEHLIKANTCVNGDLVSELGLAQATISQHLRELKDAGIIQGTIEGVSVCYCINPERWEMVQKLFQGFFQSFPRPDANNCC